MARYWTKPRTVFVVWAAVELIGWLSTHFFFMDLRANWVWLVLSVIAFVPMIRYMPWRIRKLRNILLLWLITVGVGMVFSFLAFEVPTLYILIPNLGIFWLLLMGVAFFINALWWTPGLFIIGGVAQIVAGLLPLMFQDLLFYQYLIAAVAGPGAMLILLPNRPLRRPVKLASAA